MLSTNFESLYFDYKGEFIQKEYTLIEFNLSANILIL